MSEISLAANTNVVNDLPGNRAQKKPYYSHIFICLIGISFMSWFYYGWRAIILIGISALAAFITEFISIKLSHRDFDYKDVSAIESGIILALLMPASLPYGLMVASSIIMIIVGKVAFGGIKNQIFPSASVGFALCSLCWSEYILVYPTPIANSSLSLASHITDTLNQSFTSLADSVTAPAVSGLDLMLGAYAGPMGTTHIIVLAVCALTFLFRAAASRMVFFASMSVIFSMQYFFPSMGKDVLSSLVYELLSGSTLFIIIFIASDPAIVPKKRSSRLIYGLMVGGFTVLFRRVGGIENAAVFGVLASCPFVAVLDRYFYHVSDFFTRIWATRFTWLSRLQHRFTSLYKRQRILSEQRKEIISDIKKCMAEKAQVKQQKQLEKAEQKAALIYEKIKNEEMQNHDDNNKDKSIMPNEALLLVNEEKAPLKEETDDE